MANEPHKTARLVLDTLPALMQAVAADMRRMDHPMPMPHFRVLKMLQKSSMTVSQLAERCRVSLPTMSNTVTVLATNGWVERIADLEDRRKADLRITESGVLLVGEMEQHIVEWISSLFSGLSAEELGAIDDGFAVLKRVATEQVAGRAGQAAAE
jgi:DNA-binding MarR family transcriptional regulator